MEEPDPPRENPVRPYGRWLLAAFFMAAGATHFIHPAPYVAIMPSWLPAPAALVWISGAAEVLGGLGVLYSSTRVLAGWGLMLLLVAVFPANLNAALHGWPGGRLPAWVMWVRLPFQLLLLWWVYRVCIARGHKA